jgi:hypothetical protein
MGNILVESQPIIVEVGVPDSVFPVEVTEEVIRVEIPGDEIHVVEVAQQGLPGAGGSAFTHNQSTPSNEWVVNHNLGVKPVAAVLDSGGNEVVAQILHMSDNQLRVYFATNQVGQVRCV